MELEEQFNQFLGQATEEEKEVLTQVFAGFEKKRVHQYDYVAGFVGMEGGAFVDEKFIVTMPITALSNNRFGMTHGGILATFADSAMGYMLNATLMKENRYAVTTDLHIRYLNPSVGQTLTAKAFLIKDGKKTKVTQCDLYNETGTHIATITANFFVVG